ncbi:50S ribosomal protein L28 [Patescibacteria group bacterium]|nr:50S ribosomal protein L28 [Patescibacteria group bacterium]
MSKQCEICGKTYQKGNLVPRGIGNRVTKRTIHRNSVNLRTKRFEINGRKIKVKLCASCLKRLKKDERDFAKSLEETNVDAKSLEALAVQSN